MKIIRKALLTVAGGLAAAGLVVVGLSLDFKAIAQEVGATASQAPQKADPEVPAAAGSGPTALSETYQDWVVNCQMVQSTEQTSSRLCEMSQELRQQSNNQRVLLVAVSKAPNEATPRARFIVPFGLDLSRGVGLALSEELVSTVPFRTCFPAGCLANMELAQGVTDTLRAQNTAQIVVHPIQSEEPLLINISLAGFSAAHDRLQELEAGQ